MSHSFSLPNSAEEGNDRTAMVGTWHPARSNPPQSTMLYSSLSLAYFLHKKLFSSCIRNGVYLLYIIVIFRDTDATRLGKITGMVIDTGMVILVWSIHLS